MQSVQSLRILMVTHHRRFKAGMRSHAFGRELVREGHDVTLLVIANTRRFGIVEDDWDGVRVIEMPDLLWGRLRSGWDLWNLFNRKRWFGQQKQGFDIIHCFESRPATIYPVLSYLKRNPTPFVLDWVDWWGRGGLITENRPGWYQTLFGGVETYFEEAFRTRADTLTVISHALGERAERLGANPEHIYWITDGAEIDFFVEKDRLTHRAEYDLKPEHQVLGFSALDVTHDAHLALRAVQILKRTVPEVILITTGKYSPELDVLAKELDVVDNFRQLGFLPYKNLPEALSCVDVFLLPYADKVANRGRWPHKLGDYMALGRPTVSNPVGEVIRVFGEDQVGLLASEDPADFAEKIGTLLENDDLRERLGQNARWVAEHKLDWPLMAEQMLTCYRETIARVKGVEADPEPEPTSV